MKPTFVLYFKETGKNVVRDQTINSQWFEIRTGN